MKLVQLEVNDFGGINAQSPILIDFTNSSFVTVSGDQGAGKTTLLKALLMACGQLTDDKKNFINNESGKIDVNFSFVGNDKKQYTVRATKSTFSLMYEGQGLPEPMTKLKELIGVVGVSPMDIKNKPLKEIVKWLSSYSVKGAEEIEAQMDKLKVAIKQSEDTRAQANKSLKGLNEYLNNEQMFIEWEKSEKAFSQPIDIKALSAELKTAGDESDKMLRAEERLKALQTKRGNINDDIAQLVKELEEKKQELSETEDLIKKGEEFTKTAAQVKKKYDEVRKRYDGAQESIASYNKWQEIKAKKAERDEYETISQRADATAKELAGKQRELQAEILPDIKEVELVLEDGFEDGEPVKQGLYWKGRNVAQMSESEWWDVVMLIWKKLKVKVVVVDNMQSLGSKAIEILTDLNKKGCHVLAAEMNREQKELSVEYKK